jgi:hypothetical protein
MIQISISDSDLKNAAVSTALASLIQALSNPKRGAASAPATRPTPRGRKGAAAPKAVKAPKPAAKLRRLSPDEWAAFVKDLPEAQKRFLELLKKRRKLSASDAMKDLGIADPKGFGGMIGALKRWAPVRGVVLPFKNGTTKSGEKAWVWSA